MTQIVRLLMVLMVARTVYAQTAAVTFASDAGVFVGAAMACNMTSLVARYTLRVGMVLADIASDTTDKRQAEQAFAEMRSIARTSQLQTPVASCAEVRRMVRDQPLIGGLNRLAQYRLHDLGFDPGLVDGIWGPQSQAALRRYQKTRGLPVTGEVDRATLTSLEIELVY
jgi:hypothetical protein